MIQLPFFALSVFEDLGHNEFEKWFDLGIVGKDAGGVEETTTRGPDGEGEWFGQDSTGERPKESVVLDVMMVVESREEKGVFRRAGIGEVLLKRWVRAEPRWGAVVLE